MLGIIVIIHENYSKESISFSLIPTFCTSFWLGGHAFLIAANNLATTSFWHIVEHIGVVFIPPALLLFSLTITNKFKKYRVIFWLTLIFSFFSLYIILFTKLLIVGSKKFFWGYYPQYGHFGFIFIPLFSMALGFNLLILWDRLKDAKTDTDKKRFKSFIFSYLIAYIGAVDYIPSFGINFYPFGYIPLFMYTCLTARGIWRYNLIDITPALASNEIVKIMSDILIITDMKGFIGLMNPAAEKFFNVSEIAVAGKHISSIINDPLFSSNEPNTLSENASKLKNHEFVYTAKNDEKRTLHLSASILKDSSDIMTGIIYTARDRTEHKKAQDSIKKAYKTTQIIFEKMPVGIMIIGLNKKIKEANKAALDMTGVSSPDEIIGAVCHDRICPDEKGKCRIIDKGEQKTTFETKMLKADNTQIPLYKTALKTFINGEEVILESFIDITKSKELEKQLEDYKEYLEEQVQERTGKLQSTNKQLLSEVEIRNKVTGNLQEKVEALEKFRADTIKRENDMIEIKKVINQLSLELKRPVPYSLSFIKKNSDP